MRLIDADALKTTLGISAEYCDKCRWGDIRGRCSRSGDFEIACCAIEDAPTIEAVKVAQWIEDGYGSGEIVCSNCGEPCATFTNLKPRDRYCKWCGARMEGEEG